MTRTILVVDDSAMICHIVGQLLKECGYEGLTAKNGKEGYSLAKEHRPHLIIMDLEMPVMDGIQATTLIKSEPELAHVPVLIFTSLGREEDILRAKNAGCQGFLNKPICKDTLQTEVEKALQNR